MNDNNINVFISSKMRDANSTPSNFTCHFPSNSISCGENEGINVNVVSFDLLNSMYNVNSYNNEMNIISTDLNGVNQVLTNITIKSGSYDVYQLIEALQNEYFTISYSSIRNRYTFSKTSPDTLVYIQIISCGSFIGFNNGDLIEVSSNGIESHNVLNMVYYNKILLRANNIDFEVASFENITDTLATKGSFDISNILLWCSKNDVAPFQVISYNNADAATSYCYNIYNKNVSSINFVLTNEYNEIIEDAPDWTIALQFTIYKKKDDAIVKELGIMNGYLRAIFVFLNIFYGFVTGR